MSQPTSQEPEQQLPAFSFTKKVVPPQHYANMHSSISDILPSRDVHDKPLLQLAAPQQTQLPQHQQQESLGPQHVPVYNDIDYDEQIRAPRMTNANYYTYTSKQQLAQRSSMALIRKDLSDSKESKESGEIKPAGAPSDAASAGGVPASASAAANPYSPATFDLSQPTRRFSAPSNSHPSESPKTTILNYTTNNYMYERELQSQRTVLPAEGPSTHGPDEKLLRALENLNNNTTTKERQQQDHLHENMHLMPPSTGDVAPNRVKNRIAPSHHHHLNRNGTDLQQVYELKKPLCMPAVLRPGLGGGYGTPTSSRPGTPVTPLDALSPLITVPAGAGDTSDAVSPSRSNSSSMGGSTSPLATLVFDIKGFGVLIPSFTSGSSPEESIHSMKHFEPLEPSHDHWRPDNFSNSCMKCFDTFGNFFTPQRKRRHHCRFCGSIFCYDCLWQQDTAFNSASSYVGSGIASQRLTRSISNGSIQSANTLNNPTSSSNSTGTSSGSTTRKGSIDGVFLDAEAKFVVPIFSEVQKHGISTQFDDKFKSCKVCKDCGDQYQSLVRELNTQYLHSSTVSKMSSPFLFVENPHIQQRKLGTGNFESVDTRQRYIERGRQMSGIQEGDLPEVNGEQLASIDGQGPKHVPSDWSWSSF